MTHSNCKTQWTAQLHDRQNSTYFHASKQSTGLSTKHKQIYTYIVTKKHEIVTTENMAHNACDRHYITVNVFDNITSRDN